MLSAAAVWRR